MWTANPFFFPPAVEFLREHTLVQDPFHDLFVYVHDSGRVAFGKTFQKRGTDVADYENVVGHVPTATATFARFRQHGMNLVSEPFSRELRQTKLAHREHVAFGFIRIQTSF